MGTKRFFAVGLDKYHPNAKGELHGSVNTIREWEKLLTSEKFNFSTSFESLINEKATMEAVIDGLKKLVLQAKDEDHSVFIFTGHGDRMDTKNEQEPDNFNEFIWCYDGMIQDDEIREILDLNPNKGLFTLIIDSCFSGQAPLPETTPFIPQPDCIEDNCLPNHILAFGTTIGGVIRVSPDSPEEFSPSTLNPKNALKGDISPIEPSEEELENLLNNASSSTILKSEVATYSSLNNFSFEINKHNEVKNNKNIILQHLLEQYPFNNFNPLKRFHQKDDSFKHLNEVVLCSGMTNQESQQLTFNGREYSVFSYMLIDVLKNNPTINYNQLMVLTQSKVAKVTKYHTPIPIYSNENLIFLSFNQ